MSSLEKMEIAKDLVRDTYVAIDEMGGTLPVDQDMVHLPSTVRSIPTGTGSTSLEAGRNITIEDGKINAEGYVYNSGKTSFTVGLGTVAQGDYSFAEGTGNTAYGVASHVEGIGNVASGISSHAEGYGVGRDSKEAMGDGSHVEGYCDSGGMRVYGKGGHAEGRCNTGGFIVRGDGAHAEGFARNGVTISNGDGSHAEGGNTKAVGNYSHAEGYDTSSAGYSSHAEGYGYSSEPINMGTVSGGASATTYTTSEPHNLVVGDIVTYHDNDYNTTYSKVIEIPNNITFVVDKTLSRTAISNSYNVDKVFGVAYGAYSHAEGYYTVTHNQAEHAEGKYNASHDNTIHSIGIGTSTADTKNAVEVMDDGRVFIKDVGNYNGTNPESAYTLQQSLNTTPIVVLATGSTTYSTSIEPNKMYMFGTKETLTISSLVTGRTDIVNEFMFQFTSGAVATTLNVPASVKWMDTPDIQANSKYMVSIENNLGIIGKWSNE